MKQYYLGGYYLVLPRMFTPLNMIVHTCSTCINDSPLNAWGYDWATTTDGEIGLIKKDWEIDDNAIKAIQQWRNEADKAGTAGWPNVFTTANAANEYKARFFSHIPHLLTMAIYLKEEQADLMLEQTAPSPHMNPIGIYQVLQKKIPETQNETETLIGYDIIGIEISGDLHTFHCHDLAQTLEKQFGTQTNAYGLLNDRDRWKDIVTYFNNEDNGCEPVPWTYCKCKLVNM